MRVIVNNHFSSKEGRKAGKTGAKSQIRKEIWESRKRGHLRNPGVTWQWLPVERESATSG
jgi:hypothetical protein